MNQSNEQERIRGADTLGKLKGGIRKCEEYMILTGVLAFLVLILLLGYNLLYWLRYGYFLDMTPCATINLWCFSYTGYIGLDKIIVWFGENHYFYSLLVISVLIECLLKLQISDYEDRINKLKVK
jgi:hypothetical protein